MGTIPWGDIVGISTPRDLFGSRCRDSKSEKKLDRFGLETNVPHHFLTVL